MAAIAAVFISIFLGIISDVNIVHIVIRALIFAAVFFGIGFGMRFVVYNYFPDILYNDDNSGIEHNEQLAHVNIVQDNTGEYAVPELFKGSDDLSELGNIEDLISGNFRPFKSEKGIDRNTQAGYNNRGGIQDSFAESEGIFHGNSVLSNMLGSASEPAVHGRGNGSTGVNFPVEESVFTPSFGDDSGLGGLPDLDMMARAFSSGFSGPQTGFNPAPAAPVSPSVAPSTMPSTSAPPPMASAPIFTPLPEVEEFETLSRFKGGNKPQMLAGDFNPKELAEGLRSVLSKDN
jgi:hypothetical protein